MFFFFGEPLSIWEKLPGTISGRTTDTEPPKGLTSDTGALIVYFLEQVLISKFLGYSERRHPHSSGLFRAVFFTVHSECRGVARVSAWMLSS